MSVDAERDAGPEPNRYRKRFEAILVRHRADLAVRGPL